MREDDRPRAQQRRHRYALRTLLSAVTIVAVLVGGWTWWRWWTATRHMRALYNAVVVSNLDPESKALLRNLAWDQTAWKSGLIDELIHPPGIKRVVWQASFVDRTGRTVRVFLCDAFVREAAGGASPLVCVLTDQTHRLLTWGPIAPWSRGFLDASLDDGGTLTIESECNWFSGKGIYRYAIGDADITELGEPDFMPFPGNERLDREPAVARDRGELGRVIRELYSRRDGI